MWGVRAHRRDNKAVPLTLRCLPWGSWGAQPQGGQAQLVISSAWEAGGTCVPSYCLLTSHSSNDTLGCCVAPQQVAAAAAAVATAFLACRLQWLSI